MDFVFDSPRMDLSTQVDSDFDSFDEMAQVSTSPSLSSLDTYDAYTDSSLPSDLLTNFCLEYYTTITPDPIPTFAPAPAPAPAPTTTHTPKRVAHSRGRRARRDETPSVSIVALLRGAGQFYSPSTCVDIRKPTRGKSPFVAQTVGTPLVAPTT